eukprot:3249629-Prorocentrum_lima.AAC.1
MTPSLVGSEMCIRDRAYTMQAFDGFCCAVSEVGLSTYVDDLIITAEGTEDHIAKAMVRGTEELACAIKDEFFGSVALDKATLVASTDKLAVKLRIV